MGPLDIPVSVIAVGLIILGVIVVMMARAQQQEFYTTPVVTLLPSEGADVSMVQNMISSLHAIGELYSGPIPPVGE